MNNISSLVEPRSGAFTGHKVGRERSLHHIFHDTPIIDCVPVNMASSETAELCRANSIEDTMAINGENSTPQAHTESSQSDTPLPRTPSLSNLSLTEYSARPSPPRGDRKTHIKKIVPDEFLLPNGNPDVSLPVSFMPHHEDHPFHCNSTLCHCPRQQASGQGCHAIT